VACAGAIWSVAPRDINDATDAALALKPFGKYAYILFAAGLFNASLFAASILPLSTSYSICEGLGFESGVNKRFGEAPIFYGMFTFLVVVGAATVLIPSLPLVKVILVSQIVNGALLPVVLGYMIALVNKKRLMKEWCNTPFYNWIAWAAVIVMSGLTLALVALSIRQILGL